MHAQVWDTGFLSASVSSRGNKLLDDPRPTAFDMPDKDPEKKRERERLRRAKSAIAKGRSPGIVGRPPVVTEAIASAAEPVVQHIVQELVPSETDDSDEGLRKFEEAIAQLIKTYETAEDSERSASASTAPLSSSSVSTCAQRHS